MKRASTVRVVVVLALVACSSSSPSVVLVTYSPAGGTDAVSLVGTLAVHNGCIMLRADDSSFVMLTWPDGVSVGSDHQGDATILDASGGVSAAVGDRVNLGGGPTSGAATASVPSQCKTDHMFRVAQVGINGG